MRYLLGGYYGMRNVGDDLLLYVTLAEVDRIDPEAWFTVVSGIPLLSPPRARVTVVRGGKPLTTLRQLLANDVWLFGGGGLLQDGSRRSRHTLNRLRFACRAASWLGRRVALVGIGVGPLDTSAGRAQAREILKLADFVTVRDEESAVVARDLVPEKPFSTTADLAFLLPRVSPRPSPPDRSAAKPSPTLGISLLPHSASLGNGAEPDVEAGRAVAAALNHVLERNPALRIKLLEFFSGAETYGDRVVLETVKSRLRFPERASYRAYDGDALAVFEEVRACSAVLGMRFHSCVLAALGGVPFAMIAYHPKCTTLARSLRVRDEAIASAALLREPDRLAALLDRLLADPEAFRPGRPAEEMVGAAELNFQLLAEWIQRLSKQEAIATDRPRGIEALR